MFRNQPVNVAGLHPAKDQLSVKQTASVLVGGLVTCALVGAVFSVVLRLIGFGYRP